VRRFLLPLLEMTRETRIATLLVRHFKKGGDSAIHRGLGSQAWTAFCRLQHVVGDPDGSGMGVLANGKTNLGEMPRALGYQIERETVHIPDPDKPGYRKPVGMARIQWVGEVDYTANDVATAQKKAGRPSKASDVGQLVRKLLEQNNGKMLSDDLKQAVMKELDISEPTYKRAFKEVQGPLGLKCSNKGGYQGKWTVSMPRSF
jgi:hypothetical protein